MEHIVHNMLNYSVTCYLHFKLRELYHSMGVNGTCEILVKWLPPNLNRYALWYTDRNQQHYVWYHWEYLISGS